jgi:hypothetical protein
MHGARRERSGPADAQAEAVPQRVSSARKGQASRRGASRLPPQSVCRGRPPPPRCRRPSTRARQQPRSASTSSRRTRARGSRQDASAAACPPERRPPHHTSRSASEPGARPIAGRQKKQARLPANRRPQLASASSPPAAIPSRRVLSRSSSLGASTRFAKPRHSRLKRAARGVDPQAE